jgi:hypothetical protein
MKSPACSGLGGANSACLRACPSISRWMPQISDSLPLSGRRQTMSVSSEGRTRGCKCPRVRND